MVGVAVETDVRIPVRALARLRARQDKTYAGPHPTFRLQMVAFILCKDELGLQRDLAAANIAQVLLNLIPDQQWGLDDDLMPAEAVTEEPLVSIEANKTGLALTAMLWEQVAALSPFPTPEPITPELYLGQAPQIGAAHEDAYELIGGAP